jgi:isopentenyl-diphosphate delta-isomerase
MSLEAGRKDERPASVSGKDMNNRKAEHVHFATTENVEGHYRFWDDIELYHDSLPEVDLDSVDTEVHLFGVRLAAPLVITGMTGGYEGATSINRNLARAASEIGIAFGVGSERGAVMRGDFPESFSIARDYDIPLKIANIGAPQLIEQHHGESVVDLEEATQAMDLIEAHILAIHMNYLQEVVQPEGDRRAKGCLSRIEALARHLPVLAKETGAGISLDAARRLKQAGVIGFDVSGRGGTSFAAVEHFRAAKKEDKLRERLGRTFWDWGIPAPVCVVELSSLRMPIIASGGVRTGLDVARALSLGAQAAGIAGGLIRAATESYERTLEELTSVVEELRAAMFLTRSKTVQDLRSVKKVIRGETRYWLE